MKHDFQGCPMRCTRCSVPIFTSNKDEECVYYPIDKRPFSQAEKLAIAEEALNFYAGPDPTQKWDGERWPNRLLREDFGEIARDALKKIRR